MKDQAPGVPQIALRPVESLKPYTRNARTHDAEQVTQIGELLLRFGWTNPVLADADGVIAGHGRIEAAKALWKAGRTIRFPGGQPIADGWVPVIDCTGWSAEERKAYILADNKVALNAGWDYPLLRGEFEDIAEAGLDLSLTGFSADEVSTIFAQARGETTSGSGDGGAPEGIAEFEGPSRAPHRELVIKFPDEAAVERFQDLLALNLRDGDAVIWYPTGSGDVAEPYDPDDEDDSGDED